MKALRRTERLLLFAGLTLLAIFLGGHIHRSVLSREELDRFRELRAKSSAKAGVDLVAGEPLKVDFSLWSEGRIAAYKESLLQQFAPPLAVLRIPKLQLEVAVLNGTDELSLNRGVGHISGTAYPGEGGNIGVAGHRDGFFRGLKDIRPGDIIELQSLNRSDEYRVERIVIVGPKDVSVLQPKQVGSLTLVTCYPFYFIGSAPQRYIVEASLANFNPAQPQPEGLGRDRAATTTRLEPATRKVNSQSQTLNKEKTQ